MQLEWLFALIPLTVGAGFLAFGVHGLRRAETLRRRGVTARARIVRHEVRRDDEGARYHHPVASWTTQDGRECTHASRFGRGTVAPRYGVGATVVVRYDPTKPSRFIIQGWDTPTVDRLFTVLGAVLAGATVGVVLVRLVTL
ncbi:hypothetical protein C3489_06730 [Streptomyces sp. Ru71]|uniref:DUF3592 domain-containing protein n=1 Tax=Streptomyces sp. Ru71 TaxID=2080746 RepID=UPI000CDD8526|nr:DUF3592 domain-containing protein [Streptomyces sp. Ru71]POX56123.1 hypothetical protein C3489_06730 [Streptomyces sp. Ru71]